MLAFPPGQTRIVISVKSLDDSATETTETFSVVLSNAIGAPLADGLGDGSIIDNEPASPGDYDRNGSVDVGDQNVWRSSFGMTVKPGTSADGNLNGVIDAADYVIWRNNFSASTSAVYLASGSSLISSDSEKEIQEGRTLLKPHPSVTASDVANFPIAQTHVPGRTYVFQTRPIYLAPIAKQLLEYRDSELSSAAAGPDSDDGCSRHASIESAHAVVVDAALLELTYSAKWLTLT
jgi:hypothetical protein